MGSAAAQNPQNRVHTNDIYQRKSVGSWPPDLGPVVIKNPVSSDFLIPITNRLTLPLLSGIATGCATVPFTAGDVRVPRQTKDSSETADGDW
jgi:hypothetical protein